MAAHQFRLGDRVKLRAFSSANTAEAFLDLVVPVDVRKFASDVWDVTRLLPPDGTGAQDHVRSERDGMQRRMYEENWLPPTDGHPALAPYMSPKEFP